MKRIIVVTALLAFSSSMTMAGGPNNKGAGGQAVKSVAQAQKAAGTNLGQFKKDEGITGAQQGAFVSGLNKASNNPDD